MLKVGVLGGTGYAGIETVRLLSKHRGVEITRIVSQSFAGQKISDVYQMCIRDRYKGVEVRTD